MSVAQWAAPQAFPSPKSIVKASNLLRIKSFTGRACCSRQSTDIKMCAKESEETWVERWHFLKQLPHRILRDIGFAILSPHILLDSSELRLVSPDVLGGGTKTWLDSANWLATLEVDQVKQWFEAKSNNGRLGEHFAFCVEYVLLFAPFAEGRNLMAYQQVTHRTAHESRSRTPEIDKEDCESITVEVGKEDVLIKLNYGCGYKSSGFGLGDVPMSIVMDATEDVVASCDHLEKRTAQDESEMFEPDKAENFEDKTTEVIDESMPFTSEKIGKRKRKLLRKLQRLKEGNGVTVTIGEFDFLFEQSIVTKQDCPARLHSSCDRKGLSQIEETKISHWEVSVKFLLYAGPWEVLGFKTPCHAAWKCSNQDYQQEEFMCQGDSELQHETRTFRSREFEYVKKDDWHADRFLGCFLGPHVGETLYNRKTRLINQLTLSQNIHAASLLCKLFGSTRDEEPKDHYNYSSSENSCIISGRNLDEGMIESQHPKLLRVFPRALLKGYLFYEYDLWCQLHSKEQLLNRGICSNDADNSLNAELNPDHWMGWWTCAREFFSFARLPIHEHNKWYIVPKLEWLSPVVIDGEDKERIQQVFSLDKFLIVAAKVAEEAERLNIPRKRRFLVAEVSWETTMTSCHACESTANSEGSIKGCGKWTEVSRGFVVEDTWPDSRLYKPHGYRTSELHDSQ